MTAPLRGVNLGGWLVLEKWITPSLFAGTDAKDEYSLMQTPDARKKIERHRKTFITEKDFQWLADHHVTAVRIPVGYWLLKSDPPFAEGIKYLDWAFMMAEKYQLNVLLDIHALPGSQNGNDHSGRIGAANWQKHQELREASLAYVAAFGERYASHSALWGIEIINEPNPGALQLSLRQYYRRAYRILAKLLPPDVKIVYSDAWSPRMFAFALPGRRRAVMDVHLYHMATLGAKTRSLEWYYRKLTWRVRSLRRLARLHPIIVGEWSGVISGETIGTLQKAKADALQQHHFEVQSAHYESFAGTFYWTYKTEGSEGPNFWSYQTLIDSVGN